MSEVELSAGTIEYEDTGGDGPVVVLLGGMFIGASLWRTVIADLRADHRCIAPVMPLGAHRHPLRPDADRSARGLARLVAELLERLGVADVTLVGCDWGGAQLVAAYGLDERVGRLVLLPQESLDNYPPGLPGRAVWLLAKVPGAVTVALQQMRVRALRRSPLNFGRMSKRPVPDGVMDDWLRPALTSRGVRRDVLAYLRATERGEYVAAAELLRAYRRPVLILWAVEDRVMRPGNGRRLAELLPDARLVEVVDSYVLMPEDQPAVCSTAIRRFVRETAG